MQSARFCIHGFKCTCYCSAWQDERWYRYVSLHDLKTYLTPLCWLKSIKVVFTTHYYCICSDSNPCCVDNSCRRTTRVVSVYTDRTDSICFVLLFREEQKACAAMNPDAWKSRIILHSFAWSDNQFDHPVSLCVCIFQLNPFEEASFFPFLNDV